MLLDAQSFKTVLSPEVALGIVQKSLKEKGWKDFEVTDVRLTYTPFWVFSFDVSAAEGPSPSGKTALNAYTGELNDFVPVLLERPLKKVKSTDEGSEAEVEPTSVSQNEAKDTAASKVAAHVGLKKDNIFVSALTKYYIPFYRVWVEVGRDSYKFDVDALLGAPLGMETVPSRPKTWDESAKDTFKKLESPKGWAELVTGLVSGAPGPVKGIPTQYLVLGAIIIALFFLFGSQQGLLGGAVSVDCRLDDAYLGKPALFGFGERPIAPFPGKTRTLFVNGTCFFQNKGKDSATSVVMVFMKSGDRVIASSNTIVVQLKPEKMPTSKPFMLAWDDEGQANLKFEYKRAS